MRVISASWIYLICRLFQVECVSSPKCEDNIKDCSKMYPNNLMQCTSRIVKSRCKKYCGVCPDPVIQASSSREITTSYQNILKETTTLKQDVITSETISDFPITHVISTSYAVDIAETSPIYVSTTQILPTTVDQIIEWSTDYNSKYFSQYLNPSLSYISLITSSISNRLNTSQFQTTDQTDTSTFSGSKITTNTAKPVQRTYGHCQHGFNWTALGTYLERQELRIKLKGKLQETERDLKMEKKTLSAYVRSKTSARDNRKSSVVMGTIGSIVICSVVFFIILLDLFPSYKPTRNRTTSL